MTTTDPTLLVLAAGAPTDVAIDAALMDIANAIGSGPPFYDSDDVDVDGEGALLNYCQNCGSIEGEAHEDGCPVAAYELLRAALAAARTVTARWSRRTARTGTAGRWSPDTGKRTY